MIKSPADNEKILAWVYYIIARQSVGQRKEQKNLAAKDHILDKNIAECIAWANLTVIYWSLLEYYVVLALTIMATVLVKNNYNPLLMNLMKIESSNYSYVGCWKKLKRFSFQSALTNCTICSRGKVKWPTVCFFLFWPDCYPGAIGA